MTQTKRSFIVVSAISVLALTSCGEPSEDAQPAEEEEGQTELQPDYPAYDETTLVEEAALVVSGSAVATEDTALTPEQEGDTEEENPLHGLSDEEQQEATEADGGVPATAITFLIDEVHKGQVNPGDEITIVQTGGGEYEPSEITIMSENTEYFVFAGEGNQGNYNVLGGSAGLYQAQEDNSGVYEAVDSSMAPFETISDSEAETLLEEAE